MCIRDRNRSLWKLCPVEDRSDALKGKDEESTETSDPADSERGRAGMCEKS